MANDMSENDVSKTEGSLVAVGLTHLTFICCCRRKLDSTFMIERIRPNTHHNPAAAGAASLKMTWRQIG